MWSGDENDVPGGWTLCDSHSPDPVIEVPDLRNRFVVGAGDAYSVYDTGGEKEVQLTEDGMPSHTHYGSTSFAGEHHHGSGVVSPPDPRYEDDLDDHPKSAFANNGDSQQHPASGNVTSKYVNDKSQWLIENQGATTTDGEHTHNIDLDNTDGDQSHENRPPYYALAFIMKL